jgi:hypothetical protein
MWHWLQSLTPSRCWAWLLSLTVEQRLVQTGMFLCLAGFYSSYLYWKYYVREEKSKRTRVSNEQFAAQYRKIHGGRNAH